MSETPEKYIAHLHHIALEGAERRQIREELVAYMQYHPIRVAPSQSGERMSGWLGYLSYHVASVALGAALIVVLVGGVSFAAERSVPGNSLYPVKVGFSEEVRGWFAFGDEAKAVWEARRAERRLEEAEELAVAGSLSDETRGALAVRLEAHAKAAAERLGRLASADRTRIAARVSSELESSLRAHEHILLSFERNTTEPDKEQTTMEAVAEGADVTDAQQAQKVRISAAGVSPLVAQVRLSIEDIMAIRVQAEGGVSGSIEEVVLEDEFALAAQAIALARETLTLREETLDAAIAAEAHTRLSAAESSLGEAEILMKEESKSDALVALHAAVRAANEARILARYPGTGDVLFDIDTAGDPLEGVDLIATSTASTTRGQGAAIINILLDTDLNSTTGSSSPKKIQASSTNEAGAGVNIESNNNSANVKTDVKIKINTGGL